MSKKEDERFTEEVKDSGGSFAPTALVTKEGAFLVGTLLGRREAGEGNKHRVFYDMELENAANIRTTTKTMSGEYEEVTVGKGDSVSVMAPQRLDRKLSKVPIGSDVKIVYEGIEKTSKGGDAHNFLVLTTKKG